MAEIKVDSNVAPYKSLVSKMVANFEISRFATSSCLREGNLNWIWFAIFVIFFAYSALLITSTIFGRHREPRVSTLD